MADVGLDGMSAVGSPSFAGMYGGSGAYFAAVTTVLTQHFVVQLG